MVFQEKCYPWFKIPLGKNVQGHERSRVQVRGAECLGVGVGGCGDPRAGCFVYISEQSGIHPAVGEWEKG